MGVVNTAISLAAAEGIVAADHSLLRQDCGSLVLTKAWAKAKSLSRRMGFVKHRV